MNEVFIIAGYSQEVQTVQGDLRNQKDRNTIYLSFVESLGTPGDLSD